MNFGKQTFDIHDSVIYTYRDDSKRVRGGVIQEIQGTFITVRGWDMSGEARGIATTETIDSCSVANNHGFRGEFSNLSKKVAELAEIPVK